MTAGQAFLGFLVVLIVVALFSLGPLLLIWAINTLFGLGILYTLKTWAAALIVGCVLATQVTYKK